MPRSEEYSMVELVALGIAMVDRHAVTSDGGNPRPGPNTLRMAEERVGRQNPGRDMVQIGWFSDSDLHYTDAQRLDNPAVPLVPAYKIRSNR